MVDGVAGGGVFFWEDFGQAVFPEGFVGDVREDGEVGKRETEAALVDAAGVEEVFGEAGFCGRFHEAVHVVACLAEGVGDRLEVAIDVEVDLVVVGVMNA